MCAVNLVGRPPPAGRPREEPLCGDGDNARSGYLSHHWVTAEFPRRELRLPYSLAARAQAGLSADDGAATRSAVCLTGWYTAQWYHGAFVDSLDVTVSPGDVDEAVQFLLTYGVEDEVFPDVSASGFELVGAFRRGFLEGGAACDIGL